MVSTTVEGSGVVVAGVVVAGVVVAGIVVAGVVVVDDEAVVDVAVGSGVVGFFLPFPLSNRAKIQKFLSDYLEYNKTDVKRILNLKLSNDSRAVVLRNAYPFTCISKNKILLLNINDE